MIGGPGTGFGTAIVRPNLLQAYGSYIVRDSDVTLALTGTFLKNKGYRVRIFDPEIPIIIIRSTTSKQPQMQHP